MVGPFSAIFAVVVLFGAGSCVKVCQETACSLEGGTDCVTCSVKSLHYVTAATKISLA